MFELTKKNIKEILKECQVQDLEEKQRKIAKITSELFAPTGRKAVLGLDIFQYSQYPPLEQALIPYLFNKLRMDTISNVLDQENFFFQNYDSEKLENSFIDTGDGGFQIFENPFEAIVFAIYFQMTLHRYNFAGGNDDESLFNIIGKLKMRYVITYDIIYTLKLGKRQNFYGTGIINNARILSRDKLDRCLIDENVLDWFYKELNGFENLSIITDKDLDKINLFKDYDKTKISESLKKKSLLFNITEDITQGSILGADVMHIGTVKAKKSELSVHCIYIKVGVKSNNDKKTFNKMATSLGSLNPQGLSDNN